MKTPYYGREESEKSMRAWRLLQYAKSILLVSKTLITLARFFGGC